MSKVVAEVGTKEVEEVQQAVKYYYLLSFIVAETPHGKSPWTKKIICLSFVLFPFPEFPR